MALVKVARDLRYDDHESSGAIVVVAISKNAS
jgi:hypothetical protein